MHLLYIAIALFVTPADGWLTDFEQAKKNAAEEDKLILLKFSGSDWCGNCKRLEKEFFETEDFKAFYGEHFVLMNADFPMKKQNKLSKEMQSQNDGLAEAYNKNGKFPLVVVLNAKGELVGKMKYPMESPEAYIDNLKQLARN